MTAPDTWTLLIVFACVGMVIATLVVYERMLATARDERDRAIEHAEQAQHLLTHATRHPAVRRLPSLSVIDGGNAS